MLRAKRALLIASVFLIFSTSGCVTPDAIAKFCGAAQTTLTAARPVFADMQASCLRETNSRNYLTAFVAPVTSDPGCTEIGDSVSGATAALRILSEYYASINALASFSATDTGKDAKTLAGSTAKAFGAASPVQAAVESIASFLTSTATGAYQMKQLEKDLGAQTRNIAIVIDALVRILQTVYLGENQLLDHEQNKLTARYVEFMQSNDSPPGHLSAEAKLMLFDRWSADVKALAARRASAESLVSALQILSEGTIDLGQRAHTLKARELPGLLGPYVDQMQALVPQIQKAF